MTQSIAHTNASREYFAHIGSLESQGAIAHIAQQILWLVAWGHLRFSIGRGQANAGSALRSAGIALIAANEAKARQSSQSFMRAVLTQAIHRWQVAQGSCVAASALLGSLLA